MHLYEGLARKLRQNGVEGVFGLMGDDTAKLILRIQDSGIAYYSVRHENQAVAMADAYSRTTGKLGVVVLTGGPGFCNALTAINCASRASSKVLVLVGSGPVAEDDPSRSVLRQRLKYFPHVEVSKVAGIHAHRLTAASTALAEAQESIAWARSLGTAVLALPVDVLEEELLNLDGMDASVDAQATRPEEPESDTISMVADLLEETWAASRPLIFAGRGASQSGARLPLQRLGEITGALLSTTLPASGMFHGDSFDLGVCGTYSTSLGSELIGQADVVLAFGASLNALTTYGNGLFPKATVVHVDTDLEAIGRYVEVEPELSVRADARLAGEALIAELTRRKHSNTGFRTLEVAERLAKFDQLNEVNDVAVSGLIDSRRLMIQLDRILPSDRILAVDGGHHGSFSIRYIRVSSPENFVHPIDSGSIGLAVGAGIGAAIGRPESTVVVGIGDAGFMMSVGEVETAVRYRLPLVIVVCNDEALGAEMHYLDLVGESSDVARIPTPSLADVARALGANAITVRSVEDLVGLREQLGPGSSGPLVLDCRIDPAVRGDWLDFVFGQSGDPVA